MKGAKPRKTGSKAASKKVLVKAAGYVIVGPRAGTSHPPGWTRIRKRTESGTHAGKVYYRYLKPDGKQVVALPPEYREGGSAAAVAAAM